MSALQICQNYKWFRLSISINIFKLIDILYKHTCLCDFDMNCGVCNIKIIVVCDLSAVKGFQGDTVFTVCVHACILVACLLTVSIDIVTTLYYFFIWMCDVYIKSLYREVKCCCNKTHGPLTIPLIHLK